MKRFVKSAVVVLAAALSGIAQGGSVMPTAQIPTLGEAGLVTFAVGLVGGGVFLLRRRGR